MSLRTAKTRVVSCYVVLFLKLISFQLVIPRVLTVTPCMGFVPWALLLWGSVVWSFVWPYCFLSFIYILFRFFYFISFNTPKITEQKQPVLVTPVIQQQTYPWRRRIWRETKHIYLYKRIVGTKCFRWRNCFENRFPWFDFQTGFGRQFINCCMGVRLYSWKWSFNYSYNILYLPFSFLFILLFLFLSFP